jgi:hypothetical protein
MAIPITEASRSMPCYEVKISSWFQKKQLTLSKLKDWFWILFFCHSHSALCSVYSVALDRTRRQHPNVSTTPLGQWGFRQCLPFSWTTVRGKHCRHPMGVVDTFGQWVCHPVLGRRTQFCHLSNLGCVILIHRHLGFIENPNNFCKECKHKNTITNY